jgi:hypothetical protein
LARPPQTESEGQRPARDQRDHQLAVFRLVAAREKLACARRAAIAVFQAVLDALLISQTGSCCCYFEKVFSSASHDKEAGREEKRCCSTATHVRVETSVRAGR